jgi:ABC-type transport system, involved in lipoprotein release, permease component
MIRNYFKIAWRHLRKNKLYAFVNVVGLSIGISSCLLIGVYILNEMSFDKFHKNSERIVRVTMDYNSGDQQNKVALTGTKVGPQFARTFPQVEAFVRTMKYPRVVSIQDKMYEEKNFMYADSAFFEMFSFPLMNGDAKTALDAPDKIVLTESSAEKYFGSNDPVGKILKVDGKDFIVSGVAKDPPSNTQLKFDMVASFNALRAAQNEKWWEANYVTYLLLNNKDQIVPLQKQISTYMKGVARNELKMEGNSYLTYHLEPLASVHLYSDLEGFEPNNNIIYIYVLAIVAILILVIACVNYTNLSTAQSTGRSTEVGVRKVLGADRKQLFNQFISGSLLITLFASGMALALSVILLPYFNKLSGKELSSTVFFVPQTIISLLILSVIVAFASGSYPAFILSNRKVMDILRSGFRITGNNSLKKTLIVFQFVISIFLIISTVIILQQLSYIRNKDLGYNKDHILVLPADQKIVEHYDDLKNALTLNPGVESVTGAYTSPTNIGWSDGLKKTEDAGKGISVNAIPVDEDFVKTMGLKIVAGRDYSYSDVQQMDTSNHNNNHKYSFILNESAAKGLGWTPEEAIGKSVSKGDEGIVKAVVKDFHFRSFHEPIRPLVIFLDKSMIHQILVKVSGAQTSTTLKGLEKTWKSRITHRPFEYHFLDEDYNALYKTEQRAAGVFTAFSTLAILLACLGLFALTAFAIVQRTKEIGIRKVLGATISDLLMLFSKDFISLVIIAFVIAAPIAFYASNSWLQNFTYKIQIQWWIFLLAGLATLIIAFITISLQAIKTSLINPVKNLRTE